MLWKMLINFYLLVINNSCKNVKQRGLNATVNVAVGQILHPTCRIFSNVKTNNYSDK